MSVYYVTLRMTVESDKNWLAVASDVHHGLSGAEVSQDFEILDVTIDDVAE